MAKKERVVRYSAEELQAMRGRGESKSDWARAAAMTEAETEAAIAADLEEASMSVEMPRPKAIRNMRDDKR